MPLTGQDNLPMPMHTHTSSRNFSATSRRASLGHSLNQSMVVQFTKAGYMRRRFLEGREGREAIPGANRVQVPVGVHTTMVAIHIYVRYHKLYVLIFVREKFSP